MGFEQECWGNKSHRFLTLTTLSMNVSFFNEGQQGHLFVIFIKNSADRRWGNTGYLLDMSSSSGQVKQCNSFSLPLPTMWELQTLKDLYVYGIKHSVDTANYPLLPGILISSNLKCH